MTIEINNESGMSVAENVLLRLMEYNLDELHVSPDADVAIVLVDEGAMEALHVQWLDEPGPTAVMSFAMDDLRPVPARSEERLVGSACGSTSRSRVPTTNY